MAIKELWHFEAFLFEDIKLKKWTSTFNFLNVCTNKVAENLQNSLIVHSNAVVTIKARQDTFNEKVSYYTMSNYVVCSTY